MKTRLSALALLPSIAVAGVLLQGCSGGSGNESGAPGGARPVEAPRANGSPASGADASAVPDGRTPAVAGRPRIRFERTGHDYGEINDIEVVKTTFQFTNVGEGKLVISEVKPSCGCTATALDKKVYEPGESGEVGIEFTPKGFNRQSKYITVTSNDRDNPVTRLTISADIHPFVRTDPVHVKFEKVAIGREHTADVALFAIDPELKIDSIVPSIQHLKAELRDFAPGDPVGAVKMLTVTLLDTAPWGRLNARITLKTRGRVNAESPEVTKDVYLNVFAEVFGDVQVDPAFFAVGLVEPGSEIDTAVTLKHVAGEPFHVVHKQASLPTMPDVKVYVEPVDGEHPELGQRVRLKGPVGDHMGLIRGTVVVGVDVPGEPKMTLTVMGNVSDARSKSSRR